jgi:hypothetical protein
MKLQLRGMLKDEKQGAERLIVVQDCLAVL